MNGRTAALARGFEVLLVAALAQGCASELGSGQGRERESTVTVVSLRSMPVAPASRGARSLGARTLARRPRDASSAGVATGPASAQAAPAPLSWPVEGVVSSLFGMREGRPHEGIDIAIPDGTPVRAAREGVVAYAGDRIRGYGRLVIVEHPGNLVTVYAHNSELHVKERETVGRGQLLASSGHSGRATAPHLHFEVRDNFVPRDPLKYLPPAPGPALARGSEDGRTTALATSAHP